MNFSALLKAFRKERGLTQTQTATYLGYSKNTIVAWECGRRFPDQRDFQRLAQLLEIDQRELFSMTKSVHAQNQSSPILRVGETMLTEQLDGAENLLNLAWEVWFAAKPRVAQSALYQQLPQLERMLHDPVFNSHTTRIRYLLTRCHGLLGAILVDSLENDAALFHYIQANHLASANHDVENASTYLAAIGDTYRRKGQKDQAITLLENAQSQAQQTSRVNQGHILQLLGYTYSDVGNEAAFTHSLQEATDLLAHIGAGQELAQKEFIPFEIYEIWGKGYRDLGKPREALRYLELAEQAIKRQSAPRRWYALLDISKSQALCDIGDLTNGIDLASRGFLAAYECRSLRQMNRVRKLQKKLEGDPTKEQKQVDILKELLYETYVRIDQEN
jgi:transcriptional regulator with XRE-family HTH domain